MEKTDENQDGAARVLMKNDFSQDVTDLFNCQVCLELVHKPVVNACGHMFCFLCVHFAMNHEGESNCPLCRSPYMHLPRICEQLHFFLLRAFPDAYRSRCKEAYAQELRANLFSPQFDDGLELCVNDATVGESSPSVLESGKQSASEAVESLCGKTGLHSGSHQGTSSSSSREQEHGCEMESRLADCKDEDEVSISSDCVAASGLLCSACKDLLCRPVVLNCGHVFCEECVINRDGAGDSALKCLTCSSVHPGQFPSVFLELHNYLNDTFTSEYARRQREMAEREINSSGPKKNVQPSSVEKFTSRIVYTGVGCDGCGIYPMIGRRFRCRDCGKWPGYDLCFSCYESQTTLVGRFNQKHTREHRMEEVFFASEDDDLMAEYIEAADDLPVIDWRIAESNDLRSPRL
ncbi:hypothetical protein R1flu_024593 [Riccia fluitans]|uniref:E3 ubiquitin-protein ligase PRT1 n=1 Tax=Riccia fluitans TaxID=41844 RepID=A0ABD1XYA7_9MARC